MKATIEQLKQSKAGQLSANKEIFRLLTTTNQPSVQKSAQVTSSPPNAPLRIHAEPERQNLTKEFSFVIDINPMGAVRQSSSDKWKKRPVVVRYHEFRDKLRAEVVRQYGSLPPVPDYIRSVFHIEMPEYWSQKRKQRMAGQPHKDRPDRDNCEKAILDALFEEDSASWCGFQKKYWAEKGRIELLMGWITL